MLILENYYLITFLLAPAYRLVYTTKDLKGKKDEKRHTS